MTRCMNCNGILKQSEKTCFGCNTIAAGYTRQSGFGAGFAWTIKAIFFASLTLTVASLFTDQTPPFSVCLVTSLVLLLVMSSANKMSDASNR